jgi:endonuclease-8
MPEGPTIVILCEEAAKFRGRVVRRTEGNTRVIDPQRMVGKKVLALRSWGKHFLVQFSGFTLKVHFMLFGKYTIDERKENSNLRLGLGFDNGELNLYACSVKYLEGKPEDHYDWRTDVLSPEWDPALARKKLRAMPDTLVCDALLDQSLFSGAGNIIKNEVLWRIRVSPLSTVGALPPRKLDALVRDARDYSFLFLEWKKQYVLRKHWQAHRKSTCPRCGIKLRIAHLGRTHRRAFWCEHCQVQYGGLAEAPERAYEPRRKPAAKKARVSAKKPAAAAKKATSRAKKAAKPARKAAKPLKKALARGE